MTINLYSRFHAPIPLSRDIPARFKPQLIDRAEKGVVEDGENEFLIQELSGPGFTVRFQSLFLRN
jgi:hypothetical protein